MNPKIQKITNEIERTKTKIAELQALLPELERRLVDLENSEIVKLIRTANILPSELPAFLASLRIPAKESNASAFNSVGNSTQRHTSAEFPSSEFSASAEQSNDTEILTDEE